MARLYSRCPDRRLPFHVVRPYRPTPLYCRCPGRLPDPSCICSARPVRPGLANHRWGQGGTPRDAVPSCSSCLSVATARCPVGRIGPQGPTPGRDASTGRTSTSGPASRKPCTRSATTSTVPTGPGILGVRRRALASAVCAAPLEPSFASHRRLSEARVRVPAPRFPYPNTRHGCEPHPTNRRPRTVGRTHRLGRGEDGRRPVLHLAPRA